MFILVGLITFFQTCSFKNHKQEVQHLKRQLLRATEEINKLEVSTYQKFDAFSLVTIQFLAVKMFTYLKLLWLYVKPICAHYPRLHLVNLLQTYFWDFLSMIQVKSMCHVCIFNFYMMFTFYGHLFLFFWLIFIVVGFLLIFLKI